MKYKKERTELDSWKPLADIFSCLMLMFLLILMLIILFIGYKDKINDRYDDGEGNTQVAEQYDDNDDNDDDGGGGGGGNEVTEPTKDDNGDIGVAAVKVVMVDAETNEVIKQEGIEFDLFVGRQGENLTLHTYYPQIQNYTLFETRKDGTFFLPEKLKQNTYTLKNLTAPAGYISGATKSFTVSETYFWDDPFVVRFELSMKKHSFDIYVTDSKTGEPVPNGVYKVLAPNGKTVDEIKCDEQGCGHSELLPMNTTYRITQTEPNEFYAALEKPISITITENEDNAVNIQAVKTTFDIILKDELKGSPIEGATLSVYDGSKAKIGEYTTDDEGIASLENLSAGEVYSIEQTGWAENWQQKPYKTNFSVDKMGRINGYAIYSVSGTNRMIRVNISAKDKLFGFNMRGKALILKDEAGVVVKRFSSEINGTVIEGLATGLYSLETVGHAPIEIVVEDTHEIQEFSYKAINLIVLIAVVAVGVGVFIGTIFWIIYVKKKKKAEKEVEIDESWSDR